MDDVEDGGGDQEDEFLSEQQEVLKSPNKWSFTSYPPLFDFRSKLNKHFFNF